MMIGRRVPQQPHLIAVDGAFNPSVRDSIAEARASISEGVDAKQVEREETLKVLLDAKVDPAVIKEYIKSSPTAYSPSASEIIVLKQRGVPDDILSALLERSGPALGRQASLIVITPSTGSDWLKPLGHLAWRGIMPTVILLDPASFGAAEGAGPLAALLADMGITRHVITREILDHPQAHPRGRGQWEWRILPTGKAIPTRLPGDMSWKRLA